MAAGLTCLFVGKCREASLREAAEVYTTKLSRLARCETVLIKDADSALPAQEKSRREGIDLLAALDRLGPSCLPVALDERGDMWSSRELSQRITGWLDSARLPCFIVGGAYGLSDAVRARAKTNGVLFSLGRITLPHELARVVLLEQLYRASSIAKGLPYHHD